MQKPLEQEKFDQTNQKQSIYIALTMQRIPIESAVR